MFSQKYLKVVVLAAATWSKRLQLEQIIDTLKSMRKKAGKRYVLEDKDFEKLPNILGNIQGQMHAEQDRKNLRKP